MGSMEPREDESVERLKTFHPISDPIGISGPPSHVWRLVGITCDAYTVSLIRWTALEVASDQPLACFCSHTLGQPVYLTLQAQHLQPIWILDPTPHLAQRRQFRRALFPSPDIVLFTVLDCLLVLCFLTTDLSNKVRHVVRFVRVESERVERVG